MADRSWVEVRPGVYQMRCYDCNRVMRIRQGDECNIEVGEGGKVVGVICDKCKARLDAAKAKG